MRSIISLAAVTSLSFTFIIVLAAFAAKRDYSNVFLFINGFLNLSADQLKNIKNRAFSILSNAPPLGIISTDSLTNLKFIALNELFKVAFFTKLVINFTNKVSSYNFSYGYNYILQILEAVVIVSL